MANSPNIGLSEPTQGDPAFRNNWAEGIVNPNMGFIDDYTAADITKSVAGASNVVLTYTDAASCEARHSHFIFTGVLTGNIYVLWPNGKGMNFSVSNQTTGAFTLSLGVNDGSGNPVGATVAIANGGASLSYRSDGTDVFIVGGVTLPVSIANGGTGQATQTTAFDALAPSTTKGDIIVYSGSHEVRLPVGDDGYVLTANSDATNGVDWEAPAAPFWRPLASGSVSTSSTTILTLNLSSYTAYRRLVLFLDGLYGVGGGLKLNFSTDAGVTYVTTGYYFDLFNFQAAGSGNPASTGSNASAFQLGDTSSGSLWFNGEIDLFNMNNGTLPAAASLDATVGIYPGSTLPLGFKGSCVLNNSAAAVNAIKITSAINLTGGTYRLTGYL